VIIGSGVDVIEIARIQQLLERRGERFERRVYTPREIAACRRSQRPAAHYAVRFAVKEATMKAVGTGWARGVRWVDIEARDVEQGGGLRLALHGRAAELAGALEAAGSTHPPRLHLAVSRSRTHAVAFVMLERAGSAAR